MYGPHDNFSIEDGHVLPGLMHKVYLAKSKYLLDHSWEFIGMTLLCADFLNENTQDHSPSCLKISNYEKYVVELLKLTPAILASLRRTQVPPPPLQNHKKDNGSRERFELLTNQTVVRIYLGSLNETH